MEQVENHTHNGIDSPAIAVDNLEGYANTVKTTGDQTIAGTKTFTTIPELPASDPTTDNQAVRKSYVDDRFTATETYASDTERDSADTTRTGNSSTYTKIKEIQYNEIAGTIRVAVYLGGPTGTGYGRVRVNGTEVGSEHTSTSGSPGTLFTEDITVVTGDLVQLYVKNSVGGSYGCYGFSLRYDKRFYITPGTIISN